MVFVFLCFVPLSLISLKQVGLGLAIAVLLDATIVRAVLLPAAMQLLGAWLEWLPRLEHEPAPVLVAVAPEPETSDGGEETEPERELTPVGR